MRFLTYKYGEKTFLGVLTEDGAKVLELSKILLGTSSKTMIEFIDGVSNADLDAVRETLDGDADHKGIPLAQVKLLAPITRPIHDILCVGVNYKEHLEETKRWLGDENFQNRQSPSISQSGQWRSSDREQISLAVWIWMKNWTTRWNLP